jgi:hypothetical protein
MKKNIESSCTFGIFKLLQFFFSNFYISSYRNIKKIKTDELGINESIS